MSNSARIGGNLAVKGAKYNNKRDEIGKDKVLDKIKHPLKGAEPGGGISQSVQNGQQSPSMNKQLLPPTNSNDTFPSESAKTIESAKGTKFEEMKYWKMNGNDNTADRGEDVVVIHVCDENQRISRDFCCKRDILVGHMKYFEKFLAENENGYDDIDISVHCDVEIFEWLMTYIHEPDNPPKIDKSIIVSILISSEFLQMDSLVELCIEHVAGNLSEIIKLPIDLSCISEKLINRIAFLTHPKLLSETRDRKDKILTKLYKRRVELDFSRKGSAAKAGNTVSIGGAVAATSNRTIAASLTCCSHCGCVYLENYVNFLTCRSSQPSIDFRGQLASRHSAIPGWSLTSYLKTLHSGGMGWDAIYWHVWAACTVFKAGSTVISALEVDRYTVEPDGLLIRTSVMKDTDLAGDDECSQTDGDATLSPSSASNGASSNSPNGSSSSSSSSLPPKSPAALFSLAIEDDGKGNSRGVDQLAATYKLPTALSNELSSGANSFQPSTTSLNPNRPPDILTPEIYDLLCTQMKYIVALSHKQLICKTMKAMVDSAQAASRAASSSLGLAAHGGGGIDFGEVLWGIASATSGPAGRVYGSLLHAVSEEERRRGRSPGRAAGRAVSSEPRKLQAHSLSKGRATIHNGALGGGGGNAGVGIADSTEGSSARDTGDNGTERRSRSSSGANRGTIRGATSNALKELKPPRKNNSNSNNNSRDDFDYSSAGDLAMLDGRLDAEASRRVRILLSIPPDVQHRVHQTKGAVHGVWLTEHPLHLQSLAHFELLNLIGESSLPPHKKLEWELDIMREYDEKRMDTYAAFLFSRRSAAFLDPRNAAADGKKGGGAQSVANKGGSLNSKAGTKASSRNEYYKDKGRQPIK